MNTDQLLNDIEDEPADAPWADLSAKPGVGLDIIQRDASVVGLVGGDFTLVYDKDKQLRPCLQLRLGRFMLTVGWAYGN